ncbi:MAG: hypothetical protein ABI051_19105 [Vicinamibacterales bacterium]
MTRSILTWTFAMALAVTSPAGGAADTVRTVFLSAIDGNSGFVTDLTAADLLVKENGQARDVIELAPATDVSHVTVLADDGGDGSMQRAVAELLNVTTGRALFSIGMLNPQTIRLNDYTNDQAVIQSSVSRLIQRGRLQRDSRQLSDGVSMTAKDMAKRKLSRPVIVAFTNGGDSIERDIARGILDDLRISGASLHVVHIVGVDLGVVLGDGPTQSGGSVTAASSREGFAQAAATIAKTLAHQYKLTYRLPDGVKPGERLQVTTTRPAAKIVAPTLVPTK